ncbi:MAG TPA: hypothetical protein VKV38_14900 [Trebonia sp.]|nr:hypothetical protein [Trebonia sp.]
MGDSEVEQAGEASAEIVAAQPVEPPGSLVALADHAGFPQDLDVTALGDLLTGSANVVHASSPPGPASASRAAMASRAGSPRAASTAVNRRPGRPGWVSSVAVSSVAVRLAMLSA